MLSRFRYDVQGNRDVRIDFLRGVAMACVIVDHSGISSVLRWFSYERFWVVTAAEVFVLLSGVVLGTVYGRKLARSGWPAAVRGLARRTAILYGASAFVAISVLGLALAGLDVSPLTATRDGVVSGSACFAVRPTLNLRILKDVALMRCAPWPFQIVGLYVCLVAAAVPCLAALRAGRWRLLLAASWGLYLLYRLMPQSVTGAAFEQTFPILPWQLLFVHGLAIGYHRERVRAFVAHCPRAVPIAAVAAAALFIGFALSSPWNDGPSLLRWSIVSPDRFTDLYFRYFTLSDLGVGRILNLAVALPVGYALLTRGWGIVRPFGVLFVPLGQRSLGAFVLHVYGLLFIQHVSIADDAIWTGTVLQIGVVAAIAALLNVAQRMTSAGGGIAQPSLRGTIRSVQA